MKKATLKWKKDFGKSCHSDFVDKSDNGNPKTGKKGTTGWKGKTTKF